jgi:hypothetical protein
MHTDIALDLYLSLINIQTWQQPRLRRELWSSDGARESDALVPSPTRASPNPQLHVPEVGAGLESEQMYRRARVLLRQGAARRSVSRILVLPQV